MVPAGNTGGVLAREFGFSIGMSCLFVYVCFVYRSCSVVFERLLERALDWVLFLGTLVRSSKTVGPLKGGLEKMIYTCCWVTCDILRNNAIWFTNNLIFNDNFSKNVILHKIFIENM